MWWLFVHCSCLFFVSVFFFCHPPQVPLQTLSLAMFDAVLVYTMHVVRPKASDWHALRLQARNIRRCFTRSTILTSLSVFSRCSLGVLSVLSLAGLPTFSVAEKYPGQKHFGKNVRRLRRVVFARSQQVTQRNTETLHALFAR